MKKENDIVVYKVYFGRKAGIINKVLGNNLYLIDDYFWNDDNKKVRWCKIIKGCNILN